MLPTKPLLSIPCIPRVPPKLFCAQTCTSALLFRQGLHSRTFQPRLPQREQVRSSVNNRCRVFYPIANSGRLKSSLVSTGPTSFFKRILDRFPEGRSLVFAYGSGVFQQEGQGDKAGNMVDLVFVVDDSMTWHSANLERHPQHYASLARFLGAHRLARVQEDWGARMYFNTLVPWEGGLIKYGVISRAHLLTDVRDWETLYSAGRLHKPVNILEQQVGDTELKGALRSNLNHALHTALLQLPYKFSEEDLYLAVAGLSYTGDFRMVVGEDKGKVGNIVRPQIGRFRELYRDRLAGETEEVLGLQDGVFVQDTSPAGRHHHLTRLPYHLRRRLVAAWGNKKVQGYEEDVEEVLVALSSDPECAVMVQQAVANIVTSTDKTQAVKGILTAGPRKAASYAGAKLVKMARSITRGKKVG